MNTKKGRDKGKNAKVHLINKVSTINLLAECVYNLHTLYRNYSLPVIQMLCCIVLVEADKGYFYRKDIYSMLAYTYGSFKNIFNNNKDLFTVLESSERVIKYKLSKKGKQYINSFYISFIRQLSEE